MNGACRLERDVLLAAIDDRWTDSLRRHVGECADCAAAASVAPWMHDFARVDQLRHILPDPSVVWLKAQILRGSEVIERAARPLAVYQMIAYAVVAAGWAALLTWKWDALTAWFASLSPASVVASASGSAPGSVASVPFFAIVLLLTSITVVLAFHTILAEE